MASKKLKPITFFGREVKVPVVSNRARTELSGEFCLDIEKDWEDFRKQTVALRVFPPDATRRSPRAAVAACECKTLKLAEQLAELTGHRLVKKGRK